MMDSCFQIVWLFVFVFSYLYSYMAIRILSSFSSLSIHLFLSRRSTLLNRFLISLPLNNS